MKEWLEEIQKKRTCRTVQSEQAITIASLIGVMTKRNQELKVQKVQ